MVNQEKFISLKVEVESAGAKLVVVTKKRSIADIQVLYDSGHRDFGENRVSELEEKYAALPDDINWHFIGHLQRNKVKTIAPYIYLIHSADSPRLLREINKQAAAVGRRIPVLLQYHIATEDSKYGLSPDAPLEVFHDLSLTDLSNIEFRGVMGMATYTVDKDQIIREFRCLRQTFERLKGEALVSSNSFQDISMGMSGDYAIALEQGSTMVRVGSLLFSKTTD